MVLNSDLIMLHNADYDPQTLVDRWFISGQLAAKSDERLKVMPICFLLFFMTQYLLYNRWWLLGMVNYV